MTTHARLWMSVALCSLIFAMTGCASAQQTRDKEFARGNAAVEKEQYGEAIVAYRNALKADPLYAAARQRLGEVFEKVGDRGNAVREFVRVADLLPKDTAAQLKAARSLNAVGLYEDAASRARRALENDESNIDGRIVLGQALAGLQDFDAAIKQIQEAVALDPGSTSGHLSLGAVLIAKGQNAEAEKNFETAVRLDPKSVEARLAQGTYFMSRGSLEKAEEAFRQALTIDPANIRANRGMVLLLVGSQRAAEAEPFAEAMVKAAGTPEAELTLATFYQVVNRLDAARQILEKLSSNERVFAFANLRLAALDYEDGRKAEGYKRVDAVATRMPSMAPAHTLKAQWLLQDRKPQDALAAAQLAVKAEATSAAAQYILGRALEANGDRMGAETAYTEALRLNPRAGLIQTELARLNLESGRTEASLHFAQDAVKRNPADLHARLLLARGLLGRRDVTGAQIELAKLTTSYPNNAEIRALNGVLRGFMRDPSAARREFDRALEIDAHNVDAIGGLTMLDLQAGQTGPARARVEKQLLNNPKHTGILMLAAQIDIKEGNAAGAERRLREIISINPSVMPAYAVLAQMYVQQNRLDEARREFETIVQRQPRAVGPMTIVGVIHNLQNRNSEAETWYRRALDAEPAAPVAANNLAYLYAERDHNLEEALSLARTAVDQLKDYDGAIDTLGWVFYKKGEPQRAIPQFLTCVQKDPSNPIYHYHLGLAYLKANQEADARRALTEALRLNSSFPGADDARKALGSLSQ